MSINSTFGPQQRHPPALTALPRRWRGRRGKLLGGKLLLHYTKVQLTGKACRPPGGWEQAWDDLL